MSLEIAMRLFRSREYAMIEAWWHAAGIPAPTPEMMPLDSTFMLEVDGVPWLSAVLILPNIPVAWLEAFVGNPEIPVAARRGMVPTGLALLEDFARERGYRGLFCMAPNEKLNCYYQSLGFRETLRMVHTLTKEI